jgi:DNA-binding response OmpR family regulator
MSFSQKWILVVDDDADTCEMMRVLLNVLGYEVASVQTAAEALTVAASRQFDLYLTDSFLTDLSGVELCRELKKRTPEVPVIFVSGAARESDQLEGIRAGAAMYLTKPIEVEELENALASLIE